MAKFKVGCSPITSTIYAGTVKKDGSWGTNRKDVTDTAPAAVAQHLLQKKEVIEFNYMDGKRYRLEVRQIKSKD